MMKMMKTTYHIGIYFCLMLTLLMGACTADTPEVAQTQERQLHMVPASRTFQDGVMSTRSLPSGYDILNVAETFPNGKDLLAFIAHSTHTSEVYIRRLEYTTDWQKNLTIADVSTPYYIYGFIPISDDTSVSASISPLEEEGKTYKDGVKMIVKDLKPLTASDPCVIVGIQKMASATTNLEDVDIQLGAFNYQFEESTHDYICMLLDHLYAKFQFAIKVQKDYNNLRTIKLKHLALEALTSDGNELKVMNGVTATVNIVGNTSGINPINSVTYQRVAASSTETVTPFTLFDGESAGVLTLNTTNQNAGLCLAPYDQQDFRLTAEYDIYDKKDNLIRKDCIATNTFKLRVDSDKEKRGYKHTIQITVNPTYLYVLSEPDLDNPTINVGS